MRTNKISITGKLILKSFFIILCIMTVQDSLYAQTPSKRVLLVLDVQENLLNPNSSIHVDSAEVDVLIQNVNASITSFQQNGDSIIYIKNEWTNPLMNWMTGDVCKRGAQGTDFDTRMLIVNDNVYSKSKPNSLSNNELLKYLQQNDFNEVYVCGLMAEACVKATAKGLKDEDFTVIVLEDALGSKNQRNKDKALEYFEKNEITTVQIKSL